MEIFKNTYLFDSTMNMSVIQEIIDTIGIKQKFDEFSTGRYTFLFKPGVYYLDITLDYYMQAVGLGRTPHEVIIHGSVQSTTTTRKNNVTTMFWRSAENFTVIPKEKDPIIWAVSQAAPYRRMYIKGDLVFDQNGWASGGYLGNSKVEGTAGTRSGQQWFTINSSIGNWKGGQWNRFFIGTDGSPVENWPKEPVTNVESTENFREKPFLNILNNRLGVYKPVTESRCRGVSWADGIEKGSWIDLDKFYITDMHKDSAKTINKALTQGYYILFTPGVYHLNETLIVENPNTIIYGLGMATLVPVSGNRVIEVMDVQGVSISGLIIDAGERESDMLIKIGSKNSKNNLENPISLHDIICRVGGPHPGRAEICLEVNSNDVLLDHLWLWRADHGDGVGWLENRSKNGVVIHGDRVLAYGLFVEHFQEYQTLWLGEEGKTFFYQSELPYDPPNQKSWQTESGRGYASYKVGDDVKSHNAYGLGIYAFLGIKNNSDRDVHIDSTVETPERPGINVYHITCFSWGYGTIYNCFNSRGGQVDPGECFYF